MSKEPPAGEPKKRQAAPKPRTKKADVAPIPLPLAKDSLGEFWYNDEDVQGMLPPKERKLSKVENP